MTEPKRFRRLRAFWPVLVAIGVVLTLVFGLYYYLSPAHELRRLVEARAYKEPGRIDSLLVKCGLKAERPDIKLTSDTVPVLIATLDDSDPAIRRVAAEMLAELGNPLAREPLFAAYQKHPSFAAVYALGHLGNRRATQPLIGFLNDPDNNKRMVAAATLGDLGNPSAVMPLIALIQDPSDNVATVAILSLGTLKDRQAVPHLIALLQSPAPPKIVMRAAMVALKEIKDPAAIPVLTKLRSHDDPDISRLAGERLAQLTGVPTATDATTEPAPAL